MKQFHYSRPAELKSVTERLEKQGRKARVLAGGTDLLGVLRERILPDYPEELVSLKVADLSYVCEEAEQLRIGAMTTLRELEDSALVKETFPVLWQAAHQVASPQIRNMATVGGNLCQEPRCWYYRHPDNKFDCLRKGGALCNAFTGNNPYHSIFGPMKVCGSPCENQCPNNSPIPEYLELVRAGNMDAAAALLLAANPLAAVVGRVCPHTCQSKCNRQEFDESVSIHNIERFVGDYAIANADRLLPPAEADSGKKVAIVGAGPAGLTAAWYLRRAGHTVTVYDTNEKAGGMLVYGIPAYRLPRNVVEQIVELMVGMGVVFKQNTRLGKEITLKALQEENDAVLLGIGAWKSVKLGCPGEDAEGVWGGIDFLGKAARGEETGVAGKVVAVVGGGNTAMDACRTAKRLGAAKVYNFYRRTRQEMPAEDVEIQEATEEGVEFVYLVAPGEVLQEGGRVSGVKLQKMKLGEKDAGGRQAPVPIEGAFETIKLDMLISAVGQAVDPTGCQGLELTKKNWIATEESSRKAKGAANVYAAGDGAIGPRTAIEAIADGRKAAASISSAFGKEIQFPETKGGGHLCFDAACLEESAALQPEVKAVACRSLQGEDVAAPSADAACGEAKRCFNCGCVAVNASDLAPAMVVLDAQIITNRRQIPAAEFFTAAIMSTTVLEPDEIVREIIIPKAGAGNVQAYRKFRTRKSIDFPIAGLASNLKVEKGVICSARLVFSGVAPVPHEFKEVEAFLKGKAATEEVAKAAGHMAAAGAVPLKENLFKVQLVRAFVRRAVADAGK